MKLINSPIKSSRKKLDDTMPTRPLADGIDKYAGRGIKTSVSEGEGR